MDINGLGAAYLEDYRLSGASQKIAPNSAQDFAETLKRTAAQGGGKNAVIDKTDKLYEQCLELETFLVKNLLNTMRSTVQKSGLINEGFAGKMYEDMLYDEYARNFTRSAGFGLAEQAYRQLSGM